MAMCVLDRNYESHLVQELANRNTQWYHVSQQCKRAKKEKKNIPSWSHDLELEESDGADEVVFIEKQGLLLGGFHLGKVNHCPEPARHKHANELKKKTSS
jgi:hypothetical protein